MHGRKSQQPIANNTTLNQAIRERAERRYAAYTKKNVLTMYRSINGTTKRRGIVANESAQLYQSLPSLNDEAKGDANNSGRFTTMLLGKDESKTAFVAPNSGSIEIPDAISESDDEANEDDYRVPVEQQTGNIAI